ncbi:Tex family protein [Cyclobacterium qasimii]|uniref:Transcription accessory protein (S1 RNA-binding domain) n=2 Tax=Cyclobacterium qasimii TaxID=1350429 RepID=S7VH07_9BACT|nr:Tex family protein [Cyclobacterium qasimii]EPR69271.1 Transcription accessory protein (S1 RNA-binding domain) [Cyclobacterium qasimii M12-11B]GEO20949.1 RNA-binding transcriptional accessory protein [Cyclobacterium qasimii]
MSDLNHYSKIATELGVREKQVISTANLLDEGATVPFISRYRKEVTGSLDEVEVAAVRDRLQQLRDLDKRKEAIIKSIDEQGKLTDELAGKVLAAETMSVLEDIYLPFKPKRRTKGTIAKEKGLEPLAHLIFEQSAIDLNKTAEEYLNEELGVGSKEDALSGARDIIAEWINEDAEIRKKLRTLFIEEGEFVSKVIPGKEAEAIKYKDYFDWKEPVKTAPSHRILAMRRGEKELFLMLDTGPDDLSAIKIIEKAVVTEGNTSSEQVKLAAKDGYKRLLKPSMETEVRLYAKKKADEDAIKVFTENLRQLLLSSPLGEKSVLAIDPGFRTGCKVVCLGPQGQLLQSETIFPNEPQKKIMESTALVKYMVEKNAIEAIAIGNGTASRETENFVKNIGLPKEILVVMVNESGASIYSASDVAREEFPDYDLTVRGAVSIGRRLMDPLAELVKIDAKSIGVGQYQHDVDQSALKNSLDDTVMSCVNGVGVEVNTASKQLLTYVSGLGPSLAQNIVNYRNENGPFKSREEIKKVPRLGDKAYEQAAGFLRIRNGANPLDSSAVHPERYALINKMAQDMGVSVDELVKTEELVQKIPLKDYVNEQVGLPTLKDILEELGKPGRDPREKFEVFQFEDGVNEMKDLKVGMKLPGIVTNITQFGAFVDIGVHQDGLVHLSQMADRFIKDPKEVVAVSQKVMATVMEVDMPRKRIGLSLKSDPFAANTSSSRKDKPRRKLQESKQEVKESMEDKLAQLRKKFGN